MLDADAVAQYTNGRLAADDETERYLASAYAAARAYCNWHVTPLKLDDEFVLDGPNDQVLALPTMYLSKLSAVTEDGVELDMTELLWQPGTGGIPVRATVRKLFNRYWGWKRNSIAVKMDHGYTSVSDFDQAVLEAVDRMSLTVGETVGASGPMVYKRVDTVHYQWAPTGGALLNTDLLDKYKVLEV